MWQMILNTVFGRGGIASALADAYEQRSNARTEQDRIAAEVEIARAEVRYKTLSLGGYTTAVIQFLWALPFILFNAKLIIWDKMLGWGVTDDLSDNLKVIELTIISFYFGGTTLTNSIRLLKR